MPFEQPQAIDMDAIQALVRERCGLAGDTPGQLAGAVRARMATCGAGSVADYRQRLCHDEQELHALIEQLTIKTSYLYREPRHDQMVLDYLLAPLLERAGDTPVRILSAGCAHGEELVSLAIALSEGYGEAVLDRIALTGADIDRAALRVAATGRYAEEAFHTMPAALRERYFTPLAEGGGVLHERLLARLDYVPINLADTAPSPAPHDQDVIFYRNVSIYFGREARMRALRHLATRLKPEGALIVGLGEIPSNDLGVLRLAQREGCRYFARDTGLD